MSRKNIKYRISGSAIRVNKTEPIEIEVFKKVTVKYNIICMSRCKIVFELIRDTSKKIECRISSNGKWYRNTVNLPFDGRYQVYLLNKDGKFMQYYLKIQSSFLE